MSDEKQYRAGQFRPGQSGNPGGRRKELSSKIREDYKGDVIAIFEVMRDLALGRTPEGYEKAEIKTSDRVKAASEVLDRALGKAPQQIDGDINVGITPRDAAVLAAIQLTPHERRKRLEVIASEDDAAIEDFEREHAADADTE